MKNIKKIYKSFLVVSIFILSFLYVQNIYAQGQQVTIEGQDLTLVDDSGIWINQVAETPAINKDICLKPVGDSGISVTCDEADSVKSSDINTYVSDGTSGISDLSTSSVTDSADSLPVSGGNTFAVTFVIIFVAIYVFKYIINRLPSKNKYAILR